VSTKETEQVKPVEEVKTEAKETDAKETNAKEAKSEAPLCLEETIYIRDYLDIGLPRNFYDRTDIRNKYQFKKINIDNIIFNLLKDILEMILMIEVDINDIEIDRNDHLFPRVLSRALTQRNEKFNFLCKANFAVWRNRAQHNNILLDKRLSRLEQEIIISEKVMKQLRQQPQEDKNDFLLRFTFIARKVSRPDAINISLHADDETSRMILKNEFRIILHRWIPKIINMTMNYMMNMNITYSELYYHKKRREEKKVPSKGRGRN